MRVQASRVEIDGAVSGEIGQGLMVLLGITAGDTKEHCDFLVDKLVHLRIFTDEQEKMNLSLKDIGGEMLIVSQFTLYGDCKKGRRPSFVAAARPETAIPLYEYFIEAAKQQGIKKVATGQFGADMQVYIQNDGPVTLMLDRAGIANEDGQSHQGLYDFAYLRHIPNMTVLAPADEEELRLMTRTACAFDGPCSIRYPKSAVSLPEGYSVSSFEIGKWLTLREGTDAVILAVGSMVATALRVAEALAQDGISLTVVNASTVKPLDMECLRRVFEMERPIFTLEEHVRMAGFGSSVLEAASEMGFQPRVKLLAVDDYFVPHGDHAHLLRDTGLDDESVIRTIRTELNREESTNV